MLSCPRRRIVSRRCLTSFPTSRVAEGLCSSVRVLCCDWHRNAPQPGDFVVFMCWIAGSRAGNHCMDQKGACVLPWRATLCSRGGTAELLQHYTRERRCLLKGHMASMRNIQSARLEPIRLRRGHGTVPQQSGPEWGRDGLWTASHPLSRGEGSPYSSPLLIARIAAPWDAMRNGGVRCWLGR